MVAPVIPDKIRSGFEKYQTGNVASTCVSAEADDGLGNFRPIAGHFVYDLV